MLFGDIIEGLLTSSITGGLIFYVAGKLMQRYPPKWPNYFYGYRTISSLKTKETFDAANVFCAALMVKYGAGLMIAGFFTGLFFKVSYLWLFFSVGMLSFIICVVSLLIKTEKYLAKHFDKLGRRLT